MFKLHLYQFNDLYKKYRLVQYGIDNFVNGTVKMGNVQGQRHF